MTIERDTRQTGMGRRSAPTPGQALNDVSRLLRRRFEQQLKLKMVSSITHPQARMVMCLEIHGGINQATLAQILEMEPSTLVRVIDRLEAAQLVERCRDPQDRRAWILNLTPRARPLVEQIYAIGLEVWDEAMTGMDQATCDAMVRGLDLLKGNLMKGLGRAPDEFKEAVNG